MQKRNKMFVLCVTALTFTLVAAALWKLSANRTQETPRTPAGLFAWNEDWRPEDQKQLFNTMEALRITELYQAVKPGGLTNPDFRDFVAQCTSKNIKVYYLAGEAEWGIDPEMQGLLEQIDLLDAYNSSVAENEQCSGIFFDVEPYLTDAWDGGKEEVLRTYSEIMPQAYDYAHARGLEVTLCMPVWYDSVNKDLLEIVIETACDRAAFMNYDRSGEIPNLKTEMRYCERYQKPLICIFEFQPPGVHSLTENETYYSLGTQAALENYEALKAHYGYDNTMFAYHYYTTLVELLAEQ